MASGLMRSLCRSASCRLVGCERIRRIVHTGEGYRNSIPANDLSLSGAVLKLNGGVSGFGKYSLLPIACSTSHEPVLLLTRRSGPCSLPLELRVAADKRANGRQLAAR